MNSFEDIKTLSDQELDAAISEKYGKDWNPKEVDDTDELIKEWFRRLLTDVID